MKTWWHHCARGLQMMTFSSYRPATPDANVASHHGSESASCPNGGLKSTKRDRRWKMAGGSKWKKKDQNKGKGRMHLFVIVVIVKSNNCEKWCKWWIWFADFLIYLDLTCQRLFTLRPAVDVGEMWLLPVTRPILSPRFFKGPSLRANHSWPPWASQRKENGDTCSGLLAVLNCLWPSVIKVPHPLLTATELI